MIRSVRLVSLPVLLVLAACSGGAPAEAPAAGPMPAPELFVGTALATVDGHQVGSVSWESYAARENPADGKAWSAAEKKEILEQAIDEEVLFREAFERGVYQDPKVRKILVNLLLRQEIYEKVGAETFSDAELQAYFEQHESEFVIPEKVQLKRIFVAVSNQRDEAAARDLADDLYAKVKADPEAWREVAIASSDDPFARRGGDIGFLDREGKPGVPMPVVERAFTLEQGDISEPFLAAGGFNILYVPTKRERIERTFEQMRGAVLRRLKNQRYEELTNSFIDQLRKEAAIAVDDAALQSFEPKAQNLPGVRMSEARAQAAGSGTIGSIDPDQPVTGDPLLDAGSANDQMLREMEEGDGELEGNEGE